MEHKLCLLVIVAVVAALASASSGCKPTTRLPHPDSCRQYMRCSDKGVWTEGKCPWYEHFDTKTSTCRNWISATCGKVECREGDKQAVPAQCQQYKECVGGKWKTNKCTLTEKFNPTTKNCEMFYDCSKSPECTDDTKKAIPGDCNHYQLCTKGKYQTKQCSWKKNFNPKSLGCELSYKCTYCKETTKTPDPKNCQNYNVCEKGVMKNKSCSFGQRYDEKTQTCRLGWHVDCKDRTTERPRKTTTTMRPRTSRKPTPTPPKGMCADRTTSPVNGSCTDYFQCDPATGHMTLKSCRLCKNFDPKLGECVWPWQYPCKSPPPEPTRPPSPACNNGEINVVTCKTYQLCLNGAWKEEECSWYQKFDTAKKECRFSWWAKCTI